MATTKTKTVRQKSLSGSSPCVTNIAEIGIYLWHEFKGDTTVETINSEISSASFKEPIFGEKTKWVKVKPVFLEAGKYKVIKESFGSTASAVILPLVSDYKGVGYVTDYCEFELKFDSLLKLFGTDQFANDVLGDGDYDLSKESALFTLKGISDGIYKMFWHRKEIGKNIVKIKGQGSSAALVGENNSHYQFDGATNEKFVQEILKKMEGEEFKDLPSGRKVRSIRMTLIPNFWDLYKSAKETMQKHNLSISKFNNVWTVNEWS